MNRLTINLATHPFRNNAIYWTMLGACAALLAGFSLFNMYQYRATGAGIEKWSQTLQDHKQRLDDLSAEIAGMTKGVRKIDLKGLSDRGGFANGIILSRLFSWSTLFDRLEEVMPENVRLRSVRPAISREGIEVSVDAVTRDYASLLKFEENLIDSDFFTFVYPLSENTREAQGEINFNLTFGYMPAGKKAGAEGASVPPAAALAAPETAEQPAGATGAAPPAAPEAAGREGEEEVAPEEEEPQQDPNTGGP